MISGKFIKQKFKYINNFFFINMAFTDFIGDIIGTIIVFIFLLVMFGWVGLVIGLILGFVYLKWVKRVF